MPLGRPINTKLTAIQETNIASIPDKQDKILSDTVWDDIRVPVLSTKAGGTKDPDFVKVLDTGSGSQGVFTYLFNSSTEEELYFMVQVPHAWKFESDLHAHVHWMPTANGTSGQKVSWGLEYSVAKIGTTFPSTDIIYGNNHIPSETLIANRHYLTEIGIIDMAGIDSVSCMILCRLFRDASGTGSTDDYTSDAALIEVDFHYEIDAMGSEDEYIK